MNSTEEKQLLELGFGWNNAELADMLGVSVATVRHRVRMINKALKTRNRQHAIHIAEKRGLIDSDAVDQNSLDPQE